jgi:3-methyladenine DNA glycosylase/8-oxoguanine DNA glycosylase
VISAQLGSWDSRGFVHFEHVANLVDRIGLALPRNPTLHAFPDAARLVEGADMLVELFGVDLSDRLLTVADEFERQKEQPESVWLSTGPLESVTSFLSSCLELSPPSQSLLLFSLGRYDHIPTDEMAIRRFRYAYGGHGKLDEEDLLRFFGRFHPWGGLAFWLWEWSKVREAQAWQT